MASVNNDIEGGPTAPETEEENSIGDVVSLIAIGFLFVVICVVVMVITGGLVYGAFGWTGAGSGPNGTFFTRMAGMMTHAANTIVTPGYSAGSPENDTATRSCPQFGTCPPVFGCIGYGCRTQAPPTCIPFTTLPPAGCPVPDDVEKCSDDQCRKQVCPTPRPPPPSIQFFRNSPHDLLPVWRWLDMYPPYSWQRLEVVTTLLEESLEPWVSSTFAIRCLKPDEKYEPHQKDEPGKNVQCAICKDRYDYVKCVMSSNLFQDNQRTRVVEYPTKRELDMAQRNVSQLLTQWDPVPLASPEWIKWDHLNDKLVKVITSYNVRTNRTHWCRVCSDFPADGTGPRVFGPCFGHEGNLKGGYYSPEERARKIAAGLT